MPPFGRWLRPIVAASITATVAIGSYIAKAQAEADLNRIAGKYPAVAAEEAVTTLLSGIPFIGLLTPAFGLEKLILTPAVEATMSEEDKQALRLDKAVITWAPVVGILGLVLGGIATVYVIYADLIRGPSVQTIAGAAAVPLAAVPLPAAQAVAPALVASSNLPAIGNPTTFEEGTKARAVRDVLAEHIAEGGGAKEPYAVATSIVKEKGPEQAAAGLPPSEVKAELHAQGAAK